MQKMYLDTGQLKLHNSLLLVDLKGSPYPRRSMRIFTFGQGNAHTTKGTKS
jgi:hypothetical protein